MTTGVRNLTLGLFLAAPASPVAVLLARSKPVTVA
jgi:hypothetical protein